MRASSLLMAGMLVAGLGFTFGSAGPASAGGEILCWDQVPTIVGSGTIKGTSGSDVILGSDGDDIISGNGGGDYICAGDGADTIHGNTGNDWISGGPGNDLIYGDAGDDDYSADDYYSENTGDDGDDTFRGGSGEDSAYDFDGTNWLYGDAGVDEIQGTGSSYGGSGNDYYIYAEETEFGANDAYADGGSGVDDYVEVYGGTANGGSGSDGLVYSYKDGDILLGGTGGDQLEAYANNITLNGGTGKDTCLDYAYTGATFISCEIQEVAP